MKKNETRQVRCGDVLIGGGAPVSIQSMTNVDSRDEHALTEQIVRMQVVRSCVFRYRTRKPRRSLAA